MALTSEEKEQMTNRLLYFLSWHPADGMTIRQLQEQVGEELSKPQITELLETSPYVYKTGVRPEGPINNPAHVWELRRYGQGTPEAKELKRRVMLGSRSSVI